MKKSKMVQQEDNSINLNDVLDEPTRVHNDDELQDHYTIRRHLSLPYYYYESLDGEHILVNYELSNRYSNNDFGDGICNINIHIDEMCLAVEYNLAIIDVNDENNFQSYSFEKEDFELFTYNNPLLYKLASSNYFIIQVAIAKENFSIDDFGFDRIKFDADYIKLGFEKFNLLQNENIEIDIHNDNKIYIKNEQANYRFS